MGHVKKMEKEESQWYIVQAFPFSFEHYDKKIYFNLNFFFNQEILELVSE